MFPAGAQVAESLVFSLLNVFCSVVNVKWGGGSV